MSITTEEILEYAQGYAEQFRNGNRKSTVEELCCLDNHPSLREVAAVTAELVTLLSRPDQMVLIQLLTLQANN